ncbi:MAG: DHH family phosphoesterase [Candidatus Hodarchaeota archaeon]
MVLIITHGDQDGAMCAGLLGQVYPEANFYVQSVSIGNFDREYYRNRIASKIVQTREKDLIIIADIGITPFFKDAIFEKLKKHESIRFIIFDHHIDPNIDHPRVKVYYENVNNAYVIIRRWRKAPDS